MAKQHSWHVRPRFDWCYEHKQLQIYSCGQTTKFDFFVVLLSSPRKLRTGSPDTLEANILIVHLLAHSQNYLQQSSSFPSSRLKGFFILLSVTISAPWGLLVSNKVWSTWLVAHYIQFKSDQLYLRNCYSSNLAVSGKCSKSFFTFPPRTRIDMSFYSTVRETK